MNRKIGSGAQQKAVGYGRGIALCLVATASWGSLFPVMTQALRILDPFTFTTLRFAIAGVAFALLLWRIEGVRAFSIPRRMVGTVWLMGTLGFAGFGLLVFIGQRMAGPDGALVASVMMATQPMLSLLANWAIRRIVPKPLSFAFILLSFCGVLLVVTKGNMGSSTETAGHPGAAAVIALGALCWVLYTIDGALFPDWSPYRYTTLTTLFGMVSLIGINIAAVKLHFVAVPDWFDVVRVAPRLIYTACIPGFVGILCWNLGVRIVTPVNAVLFMDVIPVTAFTISAAQGVMPGYMQLVGVICTASAIVFNNLYLRRQESDK